MRQNKYILFLILCSVITLNRNLFSQTFDQLYPTIGTWKRSDTVKVFSPANLYNFIDGAADGYLALDFERLTVAYYNKGDTSITVEIYKHKTERDAYGIYSQERSSSVEYLPIGVQGYYAENVLNFVIGQTYIKLTSYKLGKRDKEFLNMIANKIAKHLGGSTTRPRMLDRFPSAGLQQNSERFIGKNFLGYTFLHSAFLADYKVDSAQFQVFIIEADNHDDCRNMWLQYLDFNKRLFDSSETGIITFTDPYQGKISLQVTQNTIIGIVGDIPQKILSSVFDEFHKNK